MNKTLKIVLIVFLTLFVIGGATVYLG